MKNLPGIKIVGFLTIVFVVTLGVYAASEKKKLRPQPTHPAVIVKFGWEGETPDQSLPLNISLKRVLKIVQEATGGDETRYKIRHYKADGTIEERGKLQVCTEPEPSPTPTATPTPEASRPAGSPTPASEPSASGTPTSGAKTQNTGAVALGHVGDAKEFLSELSTAEATERAKPAGTPKKNK